MSVFLSDWAFTNVTRMNFAKDYPEKLASVVGGPVGDFDMCQCMNTDESRWGIEGPCTLNNVEVPYGKYTEERDVRVVICTAALCAIIPKRLWKLYSGDLCMAMAPVMREAGDGLPPPVFTVIREQCWAAMPGDLCLYVPMKHRYMMHGLRAYIVEILLPRYLVPRHPLVSTDVDMQTNVRFRFTFPTWDGIDFTGFPVVGVEEPMAWPRVFDDMGATWMKDT